MGIENRVQHTVYVRPEIWDAAMRILEARGESMSSTIRHALQKIIEGETQCDDVCDLIDMSLYRGDRP